jgi:hypothetical protein
MRLKKIDGEIDCFDRSDSIVARGKNGFHNVSSAAMRLAVLDCIQSVSVLACNEVKKIRFFRIDQMFFLVHRALICWNMQ